MLRAAADNANDPFTSWHEQDDGAVVATIPWLAHHANKHWLASDCDALQGYSDARQVIQPVIDANITAAELIMPFFGNRWIELWYLKGELLGSFGKTRPTQHSSSTGDKH
jgi:hypothetical protein